MGHRRRWTPISRRHHHLSSKPTPRSPCSRPRARLSAPTHTMTLRLPKTGLHLDHRPLHIPRQDLRLICRPCLPLIKRARRQHRRIHPRRHSSPSLPTARTRPHMYNNQGAHRVRDRVMKERGLRGPSMVVTLQRLRWQKRWTWFRWLSTRACSGLYAN